MVTLRLYCASRIIARYTAVQETGSKFASTISARTVIGHDINGVVKILQFDGVSWETGYAVFWLLHWSHVHRTGWISMCLRMWLPRTSTW